MIIKKPLKELQKFILRNIFLEGVKNLQLKLTLAEGQRLAGRNNRADDKI